MPSNGLFRNRGVEVTVSLVSKSYRSAVEQVHALASVNWQAKAGQAVAIMGPSGCGKTTLLNLLGGVDRPSSGRITIDGEDLTAMSERALEYHRLLKVGFVFQFFNLIPTMTALDNLLLPMMVAGRIDAARRNRAASLLRIVGLEAKGHKRPDELSGGEQQRVAIALALANDPALILADEPTGNLDSRNAESIVKLLVSLASEHGKTVVMVSHDPKCVALFPVEYAMRDGQFVPLRDEMPRGLIGSAS